MPVLHRGVALGRGERRLAQLERRLVGEPDGPAAAEEHEPVAGDGGRDRSRSSRVGRLREQRLCLRCNGCHVVPVRLAEHREHRGGEPGLDDGALVGEAEHDRVAGRVEDRAFGDGDDRDARRRRSQLAQRPGHLGRAARARDGDHAVVAAGQGRLGGGEGVALAVAAGLTQGGDRLGDEPRGAAADEGDALPVGDGLAGGLGERGGLPPHARLAGDFLEGGLHDADPRVQRCAVQGAQTHKFAQQMLQCCVVMERASRGRFAACPVCSSSVTPTPTCC